MEGSKTRTAWGPVADAALEPVDQRSDRTAGEEIGPSAMSEAGRVSILATVLRASTVPYGYTVTVWTSGMLLIRQHGVPAVGEVFLFMVGAVLAFGVLGAFVTVTCGVPSDPSHEAWPRTGMLHFLAVGGALCTVALVALIPSGVAWPLGAFSATAMYFALATLELSLVASRLGSPRSSAENRRNATDVKPRQFRYRRSAR